MNDLSLLLRDATSGLDAPPGLVGAACARARVIRRRRAVAGSTVAAAAVVTGGAFAAQRPSGGPGHVTATISAVPTVSATVPVAAVLRVTVARSECDHPLPDPASTTCIQTSVSVGPVGGDALEEWTYFSGSGPHSTPDPATAKVPAAVVVRYLDGTRSRASTRQVGADRWVADVAAAPGAVPVAVALFDPAGLQFMLVEERH